MNNIKRCSKCGQLKPLNEFNKHCRHGDGHTSQCTECINKQARKVYDQDPEHNHRRARRWRKRDPITWLISQAKQRAKREGKEFNITKEDVYMPEYCPVLGMKLEVYHDGKGRRVNSPSLDRTDNTKGYVKGNVRIISDRANILKSDATIDELRALLKDAEKINDT